MSWRAGLVSAETEDDRGHYVVLSNHEMALSAGAQEYSCFLFMVIWINDGFEVSSEMELSAYLHSPTIDTCIGKSILRAVSEAHSVTYHWAAVSAALVARARLLHNVQYKGSLMDKKFAATGDKAVRGAVFFLC